MDMIKTVIGLGFGGLILLLFAAIIFGGLFFIVHTQEAVVIERLGKFKRIANAGFNVKIPLVDAKVARVQLQVLQLSVSVETKTKDNVFVTVPVAVQYQVIPAKVAEAHYSLGDPTEQIESYVQDNVRTSLASLNLDDAFESKDTIAAHVEQALAASMNSYGYQIVNTLITDIRPDEKVRAAMNEINAAQRHREAAVSLAEAEKITRIKAAEADSESKRLAGEGIANERLAIVRGLAEQYRLIREAGVQTNPEQLLLLTQYFDTLRDLGRTGKSSVMFVPSSPSGMGNFAEEMRNTLLSVEMLNNDAQESPPTRPQTTGQHSAEQS